MTNPLSQRPAFPCLIGLGLYVLIGLVPVGTRAAAPMFEWARSGGSAASDFTTGAATDAAGNTYILGYSFGTPSFGDLTLNSAGSLAAKYGTNGNVLWATNIASGTLVHRFFRISAGIAGDCYISGTFRRTVTLGGTNLSNDPANNSLHDFFLARYDAAGNLIWARRAALNNATNDLVSTAMVTDAAGNCYLAGGYGGYFPADFGTTNFSAPGTNVIFFVAKFDTNGTLLQVHSLPTLNNSPPALVNRISLTPSGGYCIAGAFQTPFELGGIALTNAGESDVFAASYDSGGNLLWARREGGTNVDYITGLATDALGNAYLGHYACKRIGSPYVANTAASFLTKYDLSGNVLWRNQIADFEHGPDEAASNKKMAGDAAGNTYITGYFRNTATFGAVTVPGSTNSEDAIQHYLEKMDPDGNVLWVKNFAGAYSGGPEISLIAVDLNGIAVDAAGNCSVTGFYERTNAPFDSITLTNTGAYNFSVFTARLRAEPPRLDIGQTNHSVVLSWFTNQTGFTLESTTNLLEPSDWSAVSPSPFQADIRHYVTNAPATDTRFFRLRRP